MPTMSWMRGRTEKAGVAVPIRLLCATFSGLVVSPGFAFGQEKLPAVKVSRPFAINTPKGAQCPAAKTGPDGANCWSVPDAKLIAKVLAPRGLYQLAREQLDGYAGLLKLEESKTDAAKRLVETWKGIAAARELQAAWADKARGELAKALEKSLQLSKPTSTWKWVAVILGTAAVAVGITYALRPAVR